MRRILNRLPGTVDIAIVGPRKAGDLAVFDSARNLLHGFEIALGGNREIRPQ